VEVFEVRHVLMILRLSDGHAVYIEIACCVKLSVVIDMTIDCVLVYCIYCRPIRQ